MKLAEKILQFNERTPDEVEADIVKQSMQKFFDLYNDILDVIPAISVRNDDLKKEFNALDKQVNKILKAYNKNYGNK
jgi:hypothetical protein